MPEPTDPPARDAVLATLVLESLHCSVPEDLLTSDTPIITVDEEEVWRATGVDEGDTRQIGVRRSFVNFCVVKLLEEELAAVDNELGSHVVDAAQDIGVGSREVALHQDDTALYALRYRVE